MIPTANSDTPVEVEPPVPGLSLQNAGLLRRWADFDIHYAGLQVASSIVLIGGEYRGRRFVLPRTCGGSGFTRAEARQRALGEAAERLCSSIYDENDFIFASHAELGSQAVHPQDFALFSREQYARRAFPFQSFRTDSKVNWVNGYSHTRQASVLVPAAFVYLPYWPIGGETPIGLFPSTGLSCGRSPAEALLRGILEVVERDAIMLMWLRQSARRRLDPAHSLDERLTPGRATCAGLDIFDITTDIPLPTRFALLTDSYRGRSVVACGAAARFEPVSSATKAALEALVVQRAVRKLIEQQQPGDFSQDFGSVREPQDHLALYTNPAMLPALDFLTDMPIEKADPVDSGSEDLPLQLQKCLQLLSERNLEVISVDLTLPEAAAEGLHVLRVLIPGLLPLTFGQGMACLGAKRLNGLPHTRGFDMPHPFA